MMIEKKLIILSVFLLLFWLILAGDIRFQSILSGLLFSLFIVYLSNLFLKGIWDEFTFTLKMSYRFLICLLRSLVDVFKANTDVGERVLDPKLPISPALVKFKTSLKGTLPKILLASFITLRPGTLAVDFEDDVIYVHCLADSFAKELMEGKVEESIRWIFEERN